MKVLVTGAIILFNIEGLVQIDERSNHNTLPDDSKVAFKSLY